MTTSEQKNCLACGKALKGRVDKKFCDDYCRNNYNNQQKAKSNYSSIVRNINNALLKNRKCWRPFCPMEKKQQRQTEINYKASVFILNIIHIYILLKTGKAYFYCYDYGYLPLDNDWFLIVKKRED
jgi:predicted nucleic acid-binding Zn ribbon protein